MSFNQTTCRIRLLLDRFGFSMASNFCVAFRRATQVRMSIIISGKSDGFKFDCTPPWSSRVTLVVD